MSSLVHAPGAGRSFGDGIAVKVEPSIGVDFAAFESILAPHWEGPPPHVHGEYDEAFYVLEGSVSFAVNDAVRECDAGSFVFVPRGEVHGFGNPGPLEAKILVIASPGAVEFVEGVYQVLDAPGGPDFAAMAALYARHNSHIAAAPT